VEFQEGEGNMKARDRLKAKALAHYDRMIAWALAQKPKGMPTREAMESGIGEYWSGRYCSYCLHRSKASLCHNCQLQSEATPYECCNGLWSELYRARTWKTWIKWAHRVREYIAANG
jgi:hypothetical protein